MKRKLLQEFQKGNIRFIEQDFASSSETLIQNNIFNNPLLKKLTKLAPEFIPEKDIWILSACVLLRYQFENNMREHIWTKSKIVQDYGQRGRNISNLFTAKYYEHLIYEMYKELKDQPKGAKQFRYMYDIIVNEYPFAVFINITMNIQEIKEAIMKKLSSMRKYNIYNLNVHGLGSINVKNINQAIIEMGNSSEFHNWRFNTTSTNKTIIVQIATDAIN